MMDAGIWIVPTAPWYANEYTPGPVRGLDDELGLVSMPSDGASVTEAFAVAEA
jgi:hypothetical protein